MATTLTLAQLPSFAAEKSTDFAHVARTSLETHARLTKDFPNWQSPHDARLAFFGQMDNHCNATMFLLLATADCLTDSQWRARRIRRAGLDDLRIHVEATVKAMLKHSFIHGWTLMENGLRRIISASRGSAATGPIFPLCLAFYQSYLKHQQAAQIMGLIRLVTMTRNTAHNDFSYYPDRGGDVTVSYGGDSFEFRVGQQISFMTWDFVQGRLLNLVATYQETVRHPLISCLPFISSH